MKYHVLISYLGKFLVIIGVCMFFPVPWAIYFKENLWAIIIPAVITSAVGLFLSRAFNQKGDFRYREAFALVTLGWVLASLFGMLPYIFSGTFANFTDAFFETMSGFTTTGASVLTDIESVPKSILFWRSLTHWLGGMGIIVLIVALLSQLGVGANQVFRAEVPGAVTGKITPRVAETARILWLTYLIMTALETFMLWGAGMPLFDALCHTFGTLATGGFSTKNQSIGYYGPAIQWIIILFMFIAGANWALYFQALKGKSLKGFWKDPEFKLYCGIILIAAIAIIWKTHELYHLGEPLVRTTLFQVISIITTTGYATTDYTLWSNTAQLLILLFMFIGGCSGSTSGSIKVGRHRIALQNTTNELKRLIHPRGVFSVHYGSRTLSEEVILNVMQFYLLYIILLALPAIILTNLKLDLLTAFSAVAACLTNVGPGLGSVGPAGNFSDIPSLGKWVLSFLMLLGRLEIYTVLVLFLPAFWEK